MKKQVRTGFACLALLIGISGVAQANLITNGSFEMGTGSGGNFTTLYAGSSTITGWTVKSGSVDWINSYWQASEGKRSLDLAGLKSGLIKSDLFSTTVGATYRVQFDMAGNPDRSYTKTLVAVGSSADPELGANFFSFEQPGNTRSNMDWESKSFDFVALQTTTSLLFGDATGQASSWGAALDNVRVELVPVPEPSTFFLLGAGLAGIGLFRRKLRRQNQG